MQTIKKPVSWLVCVAMIFAMFVIPGAALSAYAAYDHINFVGAEDIPSIYIHDNAGNVLTDAEGNPYSFGSLHEAIDAAQATPIVVWETPSIMLGTPNVYYVTDEDGKFLAYPLNPSSPETRDTLADAILLARSKGYVTAVKEAAAEEIIYICDPLGNPYRDNSGNVITYGSTAEALAAAGSYDYSTIVLNGEVQYARDTGLDGHYACFCESINKLEIKENLNIINYPGKTAAVVWTEAPAQDRCMRLADGVSVAVGADTGELIFDGGAVWPGSHANWGDMYNGRISVHTHNEALFEIDYTAAYNGGVSLTIGASVTIQNYVNTSGNGVIHVDTDDTTVSSDEDPVVIDFYGRMINNASEMGGAIYLMGGNLNIYSSAQFLGNSADIGGAICVDTKEGETSWSMPTAVYMDGGEIAYNSAFCGGGVALWCSGYDMDRDHDPVIPGASFTMAGGSIHDNTAHTWYASESVATFGTGGGGAVMIANRGSAFNMQGGTITGNETLPLTVNGKAVEQAGHAILVSGSLKGEQQVNITGGSIYDNGTRDNEGNVVGTVIDVQQELSLYKLSVFVICAFVYGDVNLSNLPIESELLDRLRGKDLSNILVDPSPELIDIFATTPFEDYFDLFLAVVEYCEGNSFLENNPDLVMQMQQLVESGISKPSQTLVISDDDNDPSNGPRLGNDQILGIGTDTYITFEEETPKFVPTIVIDDYAGHGQPAVEYGTQYTHNVLENQYILLGDEDKLYWDDDTSTWYVYDPDETYSVTLKVGAHQEEYADLIKITLPSAGELVDRGWISEAMASGFYWYYEKFGAQVKYEPGTTIFPTEDMTFYGTVEGAETTVTVHLNGGNLSGETSVSAPLPLLQNVDPELIYGLYENATPPMDVEERTVIAAGLTTVQIAGIVDAGEQVVDPTTGEVVGTLGNTTVYHTASAVDELMPSVNPYMVVGDDTLYVLWAYDDKEGGIEGVADFLEITVTFHPNGGTFGGSADEIPLPASKGTEVPLATIGEMMLGFAHDEVNGVPVQLVGLATSTGEKLVYSVNDKEYVSGLGVAAYVGESNGTFALDDDITLYAIWGEDINYTDVADVLEPALVIHANGGTINPDVAAELGVTGLGEGTTKLVYPLFNGAEIPSTELMEVFSVLLNAPDGKVLTDVTYKDGTSISGDVVFRKSNIEFYAVWGDKVPAVYYNNATGGFTPVEDLIDNSAGALDPAKVASLYAGIAPPEDYRGRPIIAAGLTTEPVNGVVDLYEYWADGENVKEFRIVDPINGQVIELLGDTEVYHTMSAFLSYRTPAVINPYTVQGYEDLYVLWAYDDQGEAEGIPDFLEVELELQVNGGVFCDDTFDLPEDQGSFDIDRNDGNDRYDDDYYYYYTSVIVAKGSLIPSVFFEGIMACLSHNGVGEPAYDAEDNLLTDPEGHTIYETSVLLIGLTLDESVYVNEGQIPYKATVTDKNALNSLEYVLYAGKVPANYSYVANEDASFYAVWAEDANDNGTPDIYEYAAVTLDPNSGTLTVGEVANTDPVMQLVSKNSTVTDLSTLVGSFSHDREGVCLAGFTTDPTAKGKIYTGDDRETFVFLSDFVAVGESLPVTEDVTFYAVWGYDVGGIGSGSDANGVADVLEWLVIVLEANGGTIKEMSDSEIDAVAAEISQRYDNEFYGQLIGGMIRDGAIVTDTNGKKVFAYGIQPDATGVYMTYEIMELTCNALLEPPQGAEITGIARRDLNGVDHGELEKGNFVITTDTVLYPLWTNPSPVISVTIEWGSLTFNYNEGEWSPVTHTYGNAGIVPEEDSNVITVENNSPDTAVTATFAYVPGVGYEGISGEFTAAEPGALVDNMATLPAGDAGNSITVSLVLTGSVAELANGSHTCGQCSITIAAGGS